MNGWCYSIECKGIYTVGIGTVCKYDVLLHCCPYATPDILTNV